MKMALDCVKYLQDVLGTYGEEPFEKEKIQHLVTIAEELSNVGKDLNENQLNDDKRWLHSGLLVNAMADFLNSMGKGNENSAFSTLTELLYVSLGVATHYEWPLIDAFAIRHQDKMKPLSPELKFPELEKKPDPEEMTIESVLAKFRSGALASKYTGNLYQQVNLQYQKNNAKLQFEVERLKKELKNEQKRNGQSGEKSNQG